MFKIEQHHVHLCVFIFVVVYFTFDIKLPSMYLGRMYIIYVRFSLYV